MKKFKKSTAIVLSVILSVILIAGVLFSFVPMKFGRKKWESFSGTLSMSSDLTGGLYGEFNIKTENASTKDIVSSMENIKTVFEEDGYKNVNVYAVGNKKIRVEAGYSRSSRTFVEVYNKISTIAAGAFSIRTTYEVEEDTISVMGAECVDEVKVFTNNDTKYISIVFNDEGEKQFENLCKNSSGSVYIALGDYAQQLSIQSIQSYKEFTLSDDDYANLMELKNNIVLGCMKIELDTASVKINTMSASLTAGESGSTLNAAGYASSTALVLILVAAATVAVLLIAFFAVRFGLYSVLMLITLLFNAFLFTMIMNIIPSVELGLSSFVVLIMAMSLIYTYAFLYANSVKKEYNEGKSFNASLQTAFKKSLPSTLISNITMLVASILLVVLSFGEISSAAIVFAICSFLSLFTNLALIPLLVKISISFGNFGFKLFRLKKRLDFSSKIDESASSKEAE
ncbi:MAG: hypothetical protein IJA23_05020 [Clostridia bacterium]|nr:hypothetical protein [Clostridia bacterium]